MAPNVNGSPGENGAVPLPCHAGWRDRTMGQGDGSEKGATSCGVFCAYRLGIADSARSCNLLILQ